MYKLLLSILFFFVLANIHAQTKALTENGKEVILYQNGIWKYTSDSTDKNLDTNNLDSITVNSKPFTKAASASFLVKSNVFNTGVYIDPAKWAFSTRKDNDVNIEYRFELKAGDGYGIMLTEKTPISLETMRQIALINAQKAAYDARIIKAEYRTVNGKKILCLEMRGTIKTIKVVYYNYYYSNANGTIQLVSFSSEALFDKNKNELEYLLNGLVETKD